jgi:hypothetical protein
MNQILVVEILNDEDHDYIMMLNDQSTSHTLLKPHTQNHLSSQASYPYAYNGNFDYANEEIYANYVKPTYDTFVFDDDANKWSMQIDENQHNFNNADIYESNQDFNLYKIFANPLFQSKEDKGPDAIKQVPHVRNFYFNDSNYCRDILMFSNPCYESSLHHDDHVLERKVPRGDINCLMNS